VKVKSILRFGHLKGLEMIERDFPPKYAYPTPEGLGKKILLP
jgi:hypothetical protein